MRRISLTLIFLLAHLSAAAAVAQAGEPAGAAETAVRTDTPSGFPVPRFVSLKNARTNCRHGPSFDHPIAFTFLRQGLPVQVVAETTDHWRKIRDHEGGECWVHKTTLRAVNHAIVSENIVLRVRPEEAAAVSARLARGVIVKLERRTEGGWRQVSVDGARGWAPTALLWGAGD